MDNQQKQGGSSGSPPPPPPFFTAGGKVVVKHKVDKVATENGDAGGSTSTPEINPAEEINTHQCVECNKIFSNGKALGGHMSIAHVQANKNLSSKKLKSKMNKSSGPYRQKINSPEVWLDLETDDDVEKSEDNEIDVGPGQSALNESLVGWARTAKRGRPSMSLKSQDTSSSNHEFFESVLQIIRLVSKHESNSHSMTTDFGDVDEARDVGSKKRKRGSSLRICEAEAVIDSNFPSKYNDESNSLGNDNLAHAEIEGMAKCRTENEKGKGKCRTENEKGKGKCRTENKKGKGKYRTENEKNMQLEEGTAEYRTKIEKGKAKYCSSTENDDQLEEGEIEKTPPRDSNLDRPFLFDLNKMPDEENEDGQ